MEKPRGRKTKRRPEVALDDDIHRFNRNLRIGFGRSFNGSACVEWTGWRTETGYGAFQAASSTRRGAHQFSYEQYVGPIPDGHQIDHLCHNRACVNPRHLEAVLPRVNAARTRLALRNTVEGVCKNGHRWDEDNNLYINPANGYRACRTCQREYQRDWQMARRLAGEKNLDDPPSHLDAG